MTATTDLPPAEPATAPAVSPEPAPDERLWTETAKLRSRTGVPIDRWLQLAGAVLPLLGLLAILAGWYGVSHTARAWRQTPYLVSGGLLGLGLIFLGGFAYFAYWMTKLVEQGQRQTLILERIEARLSGQADSTDDDPTPEASGQTDAHPRGRGRGRSA